MELNTIWEIARWGCAEIKSNPVSPSMCRLEKKEKKKLLQRLRACLAAINGTSISFGRLSSLLSGYQQYRSIPAEEFRPWENCQELHFDKGFYPVNSRYSKCCSGPAFELKVSHWNPTSVNVFQILCTVLPNAITNSPRWGHLKDTCLFGEREREKIAKLVKNNMQCSRWMVLVY